jgi:Leucine-rich repeat (LRR) protein
MYRKEQHDINLVLKEKHSLLKTGIQLRAKEAMDKGINKQAWDFIENRKPSDETTLEMIAYDLSNSKVYEMLCNFFSSAERLTEIIIINCNLTLFPKYLPTSLVKLDLRENLIPKIVFVMSKSDQPTTNSKPEINYLDLSSNRIEEIPEDLPQSITYLILQKNQITQASKQSFEDLNSLQTLNLSGNQIEKVEFTTKIFTCLYDLNLSFNKIKTLPSHFFYPSKTLVNFSLSNNPLQVLDNSISEMQTLQRLDLRSTKLTALPTGLCMLTRLEKLLIENVFLTKPPMYIVKKGQEHIMAYLREHHHESSRTERDIESVHFSETEKETEEKEPENQKKLDLEFSKSLKTKTKQTEKIKLKKEEFKELDEWINTRLNSEEFDILKSFLV